MIATTTAKPEAALAQISDAETAVQMTLELLDRDSIERILVVWKHFERPITEAGYPFNASDPCMLWFRIFLLMRGSSSP